jgi:hypothetical protein
VDILNYRDAYPRIQKIQIRRLDFILFFFCVIEFLFHSTTDPLNINFNIGNSNNDNSVGTGCGTNSNTSTLSSPTLPIYYDSHSNSPPLSNSMTPHCMY